MEGFGTEFLQTPPTEQPVQPAETIIPASEQPTENPTPNTETAPVEQPVVPAVTEQPAAPIIPDVIASKQPTTEQILEYFKANNREVNSIEDLFKEKEVVKEVNPYESILDAEDKQYLDFKKETGRGRKEFEFLNQDLDKLNPLDLAKEQIKRETGLDLSTEKAKEYLEEKFDIDLEDSELSVKAQIELNKFIKPIKDEYASLKEQYRKPIENKQANAPQEDLVQLTDGSMMRKADYDNLVANHQKHIDESKASVNSVTEASFKVTIDDNGTNREVSYGYEYSPEDKQNMLSIVGDVDGTMQKRYRSEQGFNHKQFAEDLFWSDPVNRGKAIASVAAKVRAEAIAEVINIQNNVNFERNALPGTQPSGQKTFPIGQANNGFGFDERFK